MNRAAAVRAGLAAAMARAGVTAPVAASAGGSSHRCIDKVISTCTWRVTGGTADERARACAYICAKERSFGLPDTRDGADVEGVYGVSSGEDAYGEPYHLVVVYTVTRARCYAKRAA